MWDIQCYGTLLLFSADGTAAAGLLSAAGLQ